MTSRGGGSCMEGVLSLVWREDRNESPSLASPPRYPREREGVHYFLTGSLTRQRRHGFLPPLHGSGPTCTVHKTQNLWEPGTRGSSPSF